MTLPSDTGDKLSHLGTDTEQILRWRRFNNFTEHACAVEKLGWVTLHRLHARLSDTPGKQQYNSKRSRELTHSSSQINSLSWNIDRPANRLKQVSDQVTAGG